MGISEKKHKGGGCYVVIVLRDPGVDFYSGDQWGIKGRTLL